MSTEGKTPVAKDLLIKVEIGSESSCLNSFRILIGMLLGPDDLDGEKEPITLMTSSIVVGVKNIEFGLRFLRNLEKWWGVGEMLLQIESAMEVK